MTMLSVWPALAIIGIAILALSIRPAFKFLDAAPAAHGRRLDSIDGLRGILASMVFFHHFVIGGYNAAHGTTGMPSAHFYPLVGPAAVAVFFMITGYLFWGRLLDKNGAIEWGALFINRLFRIYPLYLLLIAIYFAYAFHRIGIPVNQSVTSIASQVSQWLAFGAVRLPTAFLGADQYIPIVGQTWSLHYEWLFYLSLPALAVLARERSAIALTGCSLLFLLFGDHIIDQPFVFFIDHFLIGMVSVSVLRSFPNVKGDGAARSTIAVLSVVVAVYMSDQAYSTSATVLMGVFFFLIASGTSLFGLLGTVGAKRLGNMSYSVYLLQGIVSIMLLSIPRVAYHLKHSDARFWLVALAIYAALIVTSSITYCFVEKRGIEIGRRATEFARNRLAGKSAVDRRTRPDTIAQ